MYKLARASRQGLRTDEKWPNKGISVEGEFLFFFSPNGDIVHANLFLESSEHMVSMPKKGK